jgi:hypothetical protein
VSGTQWQVMRAYVDIDTSMPAFMSRPAAETARHLRKMAEIFDHLDQKRNGEILPTPDEGIPLTDEDGQVAAYFHVDLPKYGIAI